MTSLELVLRALAVTHLLLLAALILRARGRDTTALLGALCCLGAAAFVVTSVPGASGWLGLAVYPLTAICVSKAALFWLFARGLFNDELPLRRRHAAIVAVVLGFGLWQQLVFSRAAATSLETAASFGFEAMVLALVLAALREAYRGLATDLVERRRRMRVLFVTAGGGYLAAAVIVQSYNLLLGTRTPPVLVHLNIASIWLLALAASWTLLQPRPASWLEAPPKLAAAQALSALERRILESLRQAFETEHVYRQENLTIGALAQRLGTREHVLRRVINQGLGFRNFNEFLHEHRIREACRRLHRPDEAKLPVLTIALDVGYGSIGPFNRAFKARMGMTPTAFREVASPISKSA
jgi:AraC-like DNA-binding protein